MPPVVLRNHPAVQDPLIVVLSFLDAYGHLEVRDASPATFGEIDLRLANRGGARISATEIEETLELRRRIERALRAIAADVSLAGAATSVPWVPLRELFDAFAGIHGMGVAKMTKALHRKRPALVPMLDSVVQTYLEDDDPGHQAPFGERAVALVRGYKRDLDANRMPVRAVRRELVRRGYEITEVRILDVLIWSASSGA
jgi:hypothetical protein